MIRFEGFGLTYPDASSPVLRDVSFVVREGDFAVVTGATGSGKSTLLRATNGLVPRFSGGHQTGRVLAAGRDTRLFRTRELADVVGYVGQNPVAGFVTDTVEDELAYAMEQLAIEPPVMRRRVEEALDLLGLTSLRRRALSTLSGGEQQRVAIGSVLTASPRIVVLDEPTSALDPVAAEETLAALLRLVHDVGVTVVAAEHRLERVLDYADVLVAVGEGTVFAGAPAEVVSGLDLVPPVVELGRSLGWDPLPLSVRDGRRRSDEVRRRLAWVEFPAPAPAPGAELLQARGISVRYGTTVAVLPTDVVLREGEMTGLMGRNGSGKSSLLRALHGVGRRSSGEVVPTGRITLVPQNAADLLFRTTVGAECAAADAAVGAPPGSALGVLAQLLEREPELHRHPRDLSEGERLALVLAVQLVADPRVVLLDEPTRGLDYAAKGRLAGILRRLAGEGRAIVVASHDVEFVAGLVDRVVVMADGEVVTDAPARQVLTDSPLFSPQVSKVLAPSPFLSVDEVSRALGSEVRHE